MSMHLVGPYLTTTGKRRGKTKFRSAEAKRQAQALESQWQSLLTKHGAQPSKSKRAAKPQSVTLPTQAPQPIRDTAKLPSLKSWDTGAVSSKQSQQYTGNKIVGIGTLHKSNSVPVFTNEEAHDIAHMRR